MSAHSGGRIPETFIHSVLAKTDIVALIQESIKLKKAGANYSACCPFHHEKTPSFTVSPSKQFYHCFGCGKHGDALSFLMEQQSLSFVDALSLLAGRLGLSVPKDPIEQVKQKQRLTATSVLKQVTQLYQQHLKQPESACAIDYLKQRGVTGEMARCFAIGYVADKWDTLCQHFKQDGQALEILKETGLIIQHSSGRYYDRFRHRIMFPIRDKKGEVIGFGGRVLGQGTPKYLNSSESSVFHKGYCLYGMYESFAKKRPPRAVVVEGYLDVIALYQYGLEGVVATLGTAITAHHLSQLFQIVNEVVFCFDGDEAGKNAASKALLLVLPLLNDARQVRFAFVPKGEDPDSYVKQVGTQVFEQFLAQAMPLSEYFFNYLAQTYRLESVDERARFVGAAKPLLEQIPKCFFKEMMFEQLAKTVQSAPYIVRGERANRFNSWKKPATFTAIKQAPPPQLLSPAYIASAILIRAPQLLMQLDESLDFLPQMQITGLSLLRSLILTIRPVPEMDAETLREMAQEQGWLNSIVMECEQKIALISDEGLLGELKGAIQRIHMLGRQQQTEVLLMKAKNSELNDQEKLQLREILQSRESNQ